MSKNEPKASLPLTIRFSRRRIGVESSFLPRWLRIIALYAGAVALVALALWLSLALQVRFGNPFWFFFAIAVIACTWIFGKGPGWVAVALSSIVVLYYFVPPYRAWTLGLADLPFFLTFASCQVISNWVISWRRDAEEALRWARDELEIRVQERTAELKAANGELLLRMAEQKRAEEALQLVRAELARVARMTTVSELTASIAHEVNQPLAAVVANADACVAWLGLDEPNLGEARAAANRAVHGATRASEVIARIRSLIHKASPERAQLHLNSILEEAAMLTAAQAARNNVSVQMDLASDLHPVFGDRIQILQVILNLAINAIESMAAIQGRERHLFFRSTLQDDGQALICVRDTGIGMTAETRSRLFEPFFTTRSQGIGMGLPISRSIVEAHGGRLWAETEESGTVFYVTLPIAEGAAL